MKRTLAFTVAVVMLISSVAWAQHGRRSRGCCDKKQWCQQDKPGLHHGMKRHDGMPGVQRILAVADEINLTDEQKEKLEKMIVDFKLEKVDQKAVVKKAQIKLRALMRNENAKENEVLTSIDDLSQLKADVRKMQYRHHKSIRDLLTDEQKDRLKELRKERKEGSKKQFWKQHHGKEPGGHGYDFDFDSDFDG